MKIVHPHKISTEIFDIIYEAKEFIVIVSPYVNFTYWNQLAIELKKAIQRGIIIDFYVRNDPDNSKSRDQVFELGITPHLISNLHAKLYFNERSGVITSMNLLSSSNSNSIEIGCKTDSNEEIQELKLIVKDFIVSNEIVETIAGEDINLHKEKFSLLLERYLADFFNINVSVYFENRQYVIKAFSYSYYLEVNTINNSVSITIILTKKLADAFNSNFNNYYPSTFFNCVLRRGRKNEYDTFTATSTVRLSNINLDKIKIVEKKNLINEIVKMFDSYIKFKTDN
jgi:hypothetical protein